MEVQAVLKYVRVSPQKARKVIEVVKGKPVAEGVNILKFMPQKAAGIILKVLSSAIANAEQKPDVDIDLLTIRSILADSGPSLKRFRARARGRGSRILKKTSHITVILADDSKKGR